MSLDILDVLLLDDPFGKKASPRVVLRAGASRSNQLRGRADLVAVFTRLEVFRGMDGLLTLNASFDPTGIGMEFRFFKNESDPPLFTRSTLAGDITTSGQDVLITLPSANLDQAPGGYSWSVVITDPGDHDVVSYGSVAIRTPRAN